MLLVGSALMALWLFYLRNLGAMRSDNTARLRNFIALALARRERMLRSLLGMGDVVC
jgi:hypothetical protein